MMLLLLDLVLIILIVLWMRHMILKLWCGTWTEKPKEMFVPGVREQDIPLYNVMLGPID